jgi:hypothetical protein
MRVMVGGPALRFEPQLASLLGTDVATYHADDAHTQALALVKQSLASTPRA